MNSFIKYLKDSQEDHSLDSFGYVALRPDVETANIINTELAKLGIDYVDLIYLHCTLMYDISNPIKGKDLIKYEKPSFLYKDISNLRLDVLGDAVVVMFDSPDILARCAELSEFMDHSYNDHILHMSLCYVKDTELLGPLLETIKILLYWRFSKIELLKVN